MISFPDRCPTMNDMSKKTSVRTLVLWGLMLAPGVSSALSCMVVGEKTARVQSSQGEKSPVFMTESCETLKLVSGKAMVSWIARDGKPNFEPITATGVARLPAAGAEERSSNVVWAEMTSTRETRRPAFMRALDEVRPARIYVPESGLEFSSPVGSKLQVRVIENDKEKLIAETDVGDSQPLRLSRQGLAPGAVFDLEITAGAKTDKWRLKQLGAQESAQVEQRLAMIDQAEVDEAQRRVLRAMLYEQLKLPINMALTLGLDP